MSRMVELQLLDLSEDVLLRIALHLPFEQRLLLPSVCRKLRQLTAGPSELWRVVTAAPRRPGPRTAAAAAATAAPLAGGWDPLAAVVTSFQRWFAARSAAVEELRFTLAAFGHPNRVLTLPAALLPDAAMGTASLPLVKLSIEWAGDVALGFDGAPALPVLRKLAFPGGTFLHVFPAVGPGGTHILPPLPSLNDFGLADGTLAGGFINGPWLPPSVTALALCNVDLFSLPGVLAHLPRLRSLSVDRNPILTTAGLVGLSQLQRLEELNFSECAMGPFPTQVSLLTNLRILYLHRVFGVDADVAPADWDALRPLTRLIFLSISGNSLAQLPAVVAGMSQLQALHLEENQFLELPVGPYLGSLRELLLDWKHAICSPAALAAATRLTRLALTNHSMTWAVPGGGRRVPPAAAAEPLLAALAGLPALAVVEDVVEAQAVHAMTAPVAYAMWHLGRRCPRVRLGWLEGTYIGWTLADLYAEQRQ